MMDFLLSNSDLYIKRLAINSFATCLYIPLVVLWLNYTGSLYTIGNYQKTYLHWVLLIAELIKYTACMRFTTKDVKKQDIKKFKVQNLFKSVFVVVCVTTGFYVIAVLFGAPFFSKQEETFTFALIMTILTALPCCLHLGANNFVTLLLSLISLDAVNDLHKKFILLTQLTCFGAWLGSVVIPLDWNRPFQVWPIPNILGALLGCFLGNLFLVSSYLLDKKTRKKNFKV